MLTKMKAKALCLLFVLLLLQYRKRRHDFRDYLSGVYLQQNVSTSIHEFTTTESDSYFINLAREGALVSMSSFDERTSKKAASDGIRVGFVEEKQTILSTRLENNSWIEVNYNSSLEIDGKLSFIRIYLAESQCDNSLTSDKIRIRKCVHARKTRQKKKHFRKF